VNQVDHLHGMDIHGFLISLVLKSSRVPSSRFKKQHAIYFFLRVKFTTGSPRPDPIVLKQEDSSCTVLAIFRL